MLKLMSSNRHHNKGITYLFLSEYSKYLHGKKTKKNLFFSLPFDVQILVDFSQIHPKTNFNPLKDRNHNLFDVSGHILHQTNSSGIYGYRYFSLNIHFHTHQQRLSLMLYPLQAIFIS